LVFPYVQQQAAGVTMKVFETIAQDGVIHLLDGVPLTAHCVVTVLDDNLDSLRKRYQDELPQATQQRMSELLLKNQENTLTREERSELDALSEEFDAATLAKGRALAALALLGNGSHPD